jgi:hypothetical protein
MRSLASGVPSAPPGTIFALAADGGFAVPPRKFTLHFGRGKDDVHVPIGINDPYVSRLHGVLVCDGQEWWIRNKGKLPIRLPGEALLLSGHELLIEPGYTPLLIGSAKRPLHLLEIHVVGSRTTDADGEQHSRTKAPDVIPSSSSPPTSAPRRASRSASPRVPRMWPPSGPSRSWPRCGAT